MQGTSIMTHSWLDDKERPWIDDTNTKVIEVVLDHVGYGWTVDEMHENHPHLSKAQLHAALAYYFDHTEYFDQEIERIRKQDETLAKANATLPVVQKLRAIEKL